MTRTPAPALTAEEARTVARFDAAETPSEVVAAGERVERVARALCTESFGAEFLDEQTPEWQDYFRRLAAAAIAALSPSPAEEAVRRETIRAVREDAWSRGYEACYRGEQKHNPHRAALASPAPAPQGEEGQR